MSNINLTNNSEQLDSNKAVRIIHRIADLANIQVIIFTPDFVTEILTEYNAIDNKPYFITNGLWLTKKEVEVMVKEIFEHHRQNGESFLHPDDHVQAVYDAVDYYVSNRIDGSNNEFMDGEKKHSEV